MRRSTRRWNIRRFSAAFHADIPGQPMPLDELAALMKADYEKLTSVASASATRPQ